MEMVIFLFPTALNELLFEDVDSVMWNLWAEILGLNSGAMAYWLCKFISHLKSLLKLRFLFVNGETLYNSKAL